MTSTHRRDSLGRRIGYNWWREYNLTILRDTEAARQALRESDQYLPNTSVAGADNGTAYYQLTDEQFNQLHPRLTLKELLERNLGLGAEWHQS